MTEHTIVIATFDENDMVRFGHATIIPLNKFLKAVHTSKPGDFCITEFGKSYITKIEVKRLLGSGGQVLLTVDSEV
jgi:hypothetical protein